ncbi:hypothetical protein HYW19_00195 [Candidatus Woesearchaeota archaeon]|nr:hypothetical protein [Candidatus Woesearchaeota archaeon]
MGFLKFLKRDKAEEMNFGLEDDLDIPPPPPDLSKEELGRAGKEFPEFPELPTIPEAEESMAPSDEFPIKQPKYIPKEKPLPPLDFPEEEFAGKGFPEEKPFPNLKIPREEELEFPKPRPMSKPSFQAPRPLFPARGRLFPRPIENDLVLKPQIEAQSPYQDIEKEDSKDDIGIMRHKKSKGPIYVRIEKFRDILANTNTIKNNLRISSQSIERLAEIDENRERVFVKWHDAMMDMQKKFIFVDKSVFKKSR